MKPARRVVTRSPHRMVGRVCCPWLQTDPIEHETMLEHRFIVIALALPGLRRIRHQPFRLTLPPSETGPTGDARDPTYVPDFLLEFDNDDQVVVEVKPAVFVAKAESKLKAAADVLRPRGHAFFVVTDLALDAITGEHEATCTKRRARQLHRTPDIEAALAAVERHPDGVPAGHLCDVAAISIDLIRSLVARGELHADTPFAVSASTVVQPLSSQEARHGAIRVANWLGIAAW